MTMFSLLHATPPVMPTQPEAVKPSQRAVVRTRFKTMPAPALTDSKTALKLKNNPLSRDVLSPGVKKPLAPAELTWELLPPEAQTQQFKTMILEGNRVLAAYAEKRRQHPETEPNLVLLKKTNENQKAPAVKKVPVPFHYAGIPKDFIQTFLTGQFNGNFVKQYFSNRFSLQLNQAKFSIQHFKMDNNNHFMANSLHFSKQEKAQLQETARAYGYDPQNEKEMAAYFKELFQIQASVSAEDAHYQWGIAFQHKRGTFHTEALKLPS